MGHTWFAGVPGPTYRSLYFSTLRFNVLAHWYMRTLTSWSSLVWMLYHCQKMVSTSLWYLMAGRNSRYKCCTPPREALNRWSNHWSTGLDRFPLTTHTTKSHCPPPLSNVQDACTAPLVLTFNMAKLNSVVLSPLPLFLSAALCLLCRLPRAAAARRRLKRLCKQTGEDLGQP